jgi:hypothetical protein
MNNQNLANIVKYREVLIELLINPPQRGTSDFHIKDVLPNLTDRLELVLLMEEHTMEEEGEDYIPVADSELDVDIVDRLVLELLFVKWLEGLED